MAFKCFFVLAVIAMLATVALAAANPEASRDVEDDMESKILNELALRLRAARLAQVSPFGYRGSYSKRNSELINSLLGLPKVMTDAGKK